MRIHQTNRERARQEFWESLWKIAVAAIILGGLFALIAAGGGLGGPMDGTPADGRKAIVVLMFTLSVAIVSTIGSYVRYLLKRKSIQSPSPRSESR